MQRAMKSPYPAKPRPDLTNNLPRSGTCDLLVPITRIAGYRFFDLGFYSPRDSGRDPIGKRLVALGIGSGFGFIDEPEDEET
jgi:hypothetical protein